MYPHRIRLFSPWRIHLDHADRSVNLPAVVDVGSTLRRSFGLPRRIDDFERVWLLTSPKPRCDWTLNNQALTWSHHETWIECDVTNQLRQRNELRAVVREAGSFEIGAVLEIRRTAYLRGIEVAASPTQGTMICGQVVGQSESPLELYVLADGRHVHYQTVSPTEAGTPFQLALPREPPSSMTRLMVDLIHGGTVWWRHEAVMTH